MNANPPTRKITVTVSKAAISHMQEVARIFEMPEDDFGPLLERFSLWSLKNLATDNDTGGELAEEAGGEYFDDLPAAQRFAARLCDKFRPHGIVEIMAFDDGWKILIFHREYQHWHSLWKLCEEHGMDYGKEVEFIRKMADEGNYPIRAIAVEALRAYRRKLKGASK